MPDHETSPSSKNPQITSSSSFPSTSSPTGNDTTIQETSTNLAENDNKQNQNDLNIDLFRPTPTEAPWYDIPDRKFVSVEHPADVRNTDKAIRMLGGGRAVAKIFDQNPDNLSEPNGLELRFRPGDALAPPIQGKPARTRAMLLKITVPKGKGPGSNGATGKQQDVPKTLKALKGRYRAEFVGWMDHSVRFRDLADYQWNTRNSSWARNVEENLMELDLQALKKFRMSDKISSDETTEIIRPPTFTHIKYPHVYGFRQNPAIRVETIDGLETLINSGARVQTQTQYGIWSSPTIPAASNLPPPRGRLLVACVKKLEELFNLRPIWTRRALMNLIPRETWSQLKWAYPHVAYYWRSGPWRDTYVKFGVDPRSSKEFAKYQVAAFKMHSQGKSTKGWRHNKSHLFDGETLVPDGRIWQFCDVTDPLLRELADIENVEAREVCDQADGWFPNNRHFKIKWVMRRKLSNILAGKTTDDSIFADLLREPDVIPGGAVRKPMEEGREYRSREQTTTEGGDGDDLVGLDEGGETVEGEAGGLDDGEFESDSGSDDEEVERDEEEATAKPRDEKLQMLMKRFMEGQQQEGVGGGVASGSGGAMIGFGGGLGGDDFDILGDD
ncbi:hypothetical protein ABW19_dt0201448 [Dactylella cylindrospora]|nr:hypothetical protein ABW19_dt0201448 [Dactylella cylindrospora]